MSDKVSTTDGPECVDVFSVGATVELDALVEARVTAVIIRSGSIEYECVWWNERERKVETVEPWEIVKAVDGEKLRVCQVL